MRQVSGHISKQGDVQRAQASLLPGGVDPEEGETRDKVAASECPAQQDPHPGGPLVIRARVGMVEARDKELWSRSQGPHPPHSTLGGGAAGNRIPISQDSHLQVVPLVSIGSGLQKVSTEFPS
jgi:hypothetical protein